MAFGTRKRKKRTFRVEQLEQRQLLAADLLISEFVARNSASLLDQDGDSPDWIEVLNAGDEAAQLNGYAITDDADNLNKWRFPTVGLAPGEKLVVFASGKDRVDPAQELHTNFRLNGDGEYLALVEPDGQTVVQEFAPEFPPQAIDASYGIGARIDTSRLITASSSARYKVPEDDTEQEDWLATDFDDQSWSRGTAFVGFDTEESESIPFDVSMLALEPMGFWRFEETGGTNAANAGTDSSLSAKYSRTPTRTATGPGADFGLAESSATGFDGEREAVLTTESPLSNLAAFTTMGFVRPGELPQDQIGLWGQHAAIAVGFSTPTTLQVVTAGGGELTVDYPFAKEEWHHVAVVGDGTTLQIYVDLERVGSTSAVTDNYGSSGESFSIASGEIFGDTGSNFLGEMDEIAIFDRALTPAELQSLFPGQAANADQVSFAELFETDIAAEMHRQSAAAYTRISFVVDDASDFDQLKLRMQYDDGFVAYLNGSEILRANAPGEDDVAVPYDATAVALRLDGAARSVEEFDISRSRDALVAGDNVLAIHGLNVTADSPDFLLTAELDAATFVPDLSVTGYMTVATPGQDNNPTAQDLGPIVTRVDHTPQQPSFDEAVIVTAEVSSTLHAVSHVDLVYRVMFGGDTIMSMVDDGTGDDAIAGDAIFTATIPGGVAAPGEMLRWFVRPQDTTGVDGRAPLFQFDDEPTPEYFGTMVAEPNVSSDIAMIHWFVQEEAAAGTRPGTRASLYYAGEFYDNVFVRQRGGSTAGNPVGKTNFKFDFNGAQFRFDPRYGRVEEFNLNTTATDKAYVRQPMAFEAYRELGTPSSISFPIHVRRNNEFYGVFAFIEEPSEEMLERSGLDPNGALYKIYNEFTSAGGVEKKTRKDEKGNSDLGEFVRNVNQLEGEELHNYLLDTVDLPTTLNYLVGTVLVHQNDNPHKNHFMYRDSDGTGEWLYIPWDNDLTWGSNWVGSSFKDTIYADVDQITFGPVPGHDLSVIQPSHPLVNRQESREWNNHWNRLMDALLNDPIIRQMYLRRLRSGMDQFLGAPGTTDSYYDQRFDEHLQQLATDTQLDYDKWANPWKWEADQSFAQAVDIIKQEYLEVRRQHLYVTHNIDNVEPPPIDVLIPEFTTATYFVPGDDTLGTTWTELAFDDSDWPSGSTGLGFAAGDQFADLIRTTFDQNGLPEDATSVFARVPFHIDNAAETQNLTLRMKYDDGFVAYLNGTEVARSALRAEGQQFYNSRGRTRGNTPSAKFVNFAISDHVDLLRDGENVLAIHGMNSSSGNNDMLIMPELVDGIIREVEIAGIPHAQIGNPAIQFDIDNFDAAPASGVQDEEYLKLDNPHDVAVDISGWRLAGGIDHTFKLGTVVPANASIYVSPNVKAFRSRQQGPTGGQGLLVQGNYLGHLSSYGETVQLLAADGAPMDSIVTPANPSLAQQFIRITEINYNSIDPLDGDEFIEIQNTSTTQSIDLVGVTLTEGPNEPLSIAESLVIGPGGYRLFVKDIEGFQNAYSGIDLDLIAGEFSGSLDNGGERIKLDDAQGNTIVDLSFDDNDLWPSRADGAGGTLVLNNVASTPLSEMGKHYHWRGSTRFGGSPGMDATEPLGVVINEVLSNPDGGVTTSDSIELLNVTGQAVDIGGWYLSDSSDRLLKFEIPAGTTLPPGGYVTFDETHFNPSPAQPSDHHFALNASAGDEVWLVVSDGNGQVAQFADEVSFGAAARGEALGRWPDGIGRLATMATVTRDAANAFPRVGPVIISELQYHAGRPSAAAFGVDAQIDTDDLEFVEIHNPTSQSIDISGWQLGGGIDFRFDSDTLIAGGSVLVVLPFNPASAANVDRLAAFRAHYDIDDQVALVGGYGGRLNDSFDRVLLQRAASAGDPPVFYVEDEVVYDDAAPWPTADADGATLQRRDVPAFGNDPAAWTAQVPSPGFHGIETQGDYDNNGVVDFVDIELLSVQQRSQQPDDAFDLTGDQLVDQDDRDKLINDILQTSYGDANLDGVFNSHDFVLAFQLGHYEDGLVGNSTWREGDWNGDGEFDGADLTFVMINGLYTP